MSQSDTPNGAPQEQIPASISAAAEAYKVAMEPEPATPVAAMPVPQAQALETTRDVLMSNGTPDGPAVSLQVCPCSMPSTDDLAVSSNPPRRNHHSESSFSKSRYPFAHHQWQRCYFSSCFPASRPCAYDAEGSSSSWGTDETIPEQ